MNGPRLPPLTVPGGAPTRAEMRKAGIDAGIPADVVDKMLSRGLVLIDEPYRQLTLRLVVDDSDTFHDPNRMQR